MLTDEYEARLPPRCTLVNSVLPYLDAYSLVNLSNASHDCRNVVCKEAPRGRWNEIDLSGSNITDEQLHAFLGNINAKANTRLISLVGCTNIRGRGLEPLRGSNVLEDVDLRVLGSRVPNSPVGTPETETKHGPSGLDEGFVSQILSSMLPPQRELRDGSRTLALRRVALRPLLPVVSRRYGGYSGTFHRFLNRHEILKRFLPPEDPAKYTPHSCSYCHVRNVKDDEEMKCAVCRKYYCAACALPPECSECDNLKCQWCSNVMECGGCKKRSCASHGYECCGGCDAAFCGDCHEKELEFCVVCNEYYCTEACHQGAHR